MFKKSILLRFFIALFFCSPIAVYSQSCPFSDFKKMYYENDSTMYPNNFVDAINVTSDSAYFIGGSQIAKIDVNGNRLWNGSQNNSFLGSDAIPYFAPDGKYYVILSNFTLIHIDKNESIVWTKYLLDTNCYCNPIVNHITQTSDGGFIITGSKTILDTTYYRDRIFVVKTNSLGDTIWTKTLAASGADNKGYYSQETADGGYLVVANIKTSGIIQDKYRVGIIKLNANGQEQWYKIESKPIYYGAKIKGMKTNDGDCAIVASVDSVLVSTYFMKINGNGDAVVDTAYSNRKFNGGLMQLANGDYLLGMEDSLSEISASTKAILWSKAFIGSVGENIPVNSIKPLCDKAVVIAGNSGVYQYTVNCCGSDDYYYNFKSYLFKVDKEA